MAVRPAMDPEINATGAGDRCFWVEFYIKYFLIAMATETSSTSEKIRGNQTGFGPLHRWNAITYSGYRYSP